MKNAMKIASALLALVFAMLSFAACGKTETPDNTTDSSAASSADTSASAETPAAVKKVGIIQYISHPSLDNCYAGVEAALKERFGDNVVINRQIGSDTSADTDCATYASQFAAQNYDMIVAIATPAASSAVAAAGGKHLPVLFCAASDPMSIGLVESMEKPGFNCSGTSDVLDMAAQVKLIRAMQPDVKKIGVLYTTSEANSITQLGLLEEAAKVYGIEIIASGIQNDADIPAAATALAAKVDCFNNFTDNKVVNNLSVVLEATNAAGIPVYGSEIEQVKNGCLASVSIDYVALGKVTGNMAGGGLEGAKLADMAVKTISDATPVVNTDVLAAFGMTLPADYADIETVPSNK